MTKAPEQSQTFRAGLIQMRSGRTPQNNLDDAVKLIRQAREQGKTVVPGLQMFIEQAVRQFEIWTGETAPRSLMEKAAIEALKGE